MRPARTILIMQLSNSRGKTYVRRIEELRRKIREEVTG